MACSWSDRPYASAMVLAADGIGSEKNTGQSVAQDPGAVQHKAAESP
jgi:hypothetical protein